MTFLKNRHPSQFSRDVSSSQDPRRCLLPMSRVMSRASQFEQRGIAMDFDTDRNFENCT